MSTIALKVSRAVNVKYANSIIQIRADPVSAMEDSSAYSKSCIVKLCVLAATISQIRSISENHYFIRFYKHRC